MVKRTIFIIVFLIPIVTICNAQWEIIQTPAKSLIDIIIPLNENEFWIVDQLGYPIYKTGDGGETWSEINFPFPNTWYYPSLSVINSNIAWITNYHSDNIDYTGVFRTNDGGTTWTKQTTAPFSNDGSWPDFVFFWDTDQGVVVGDVIAETNRFEIYTTSDGGDTWNQVPSINIPEPENNEFGPVPDSYTVFENTVWFTTYAGNVYKSSNQGLSWNGYYVYDNISAQPPRISFKSLNNGIIIDIGQEKGFVTTNGGEIWNEITYSDILPGGSSIKYDINNISYFTTEASSSALPDNVGFMYSQDNGQSWQKHISFEGKQIKAINISETGITYLGEFQGLMYKTDNIYGINPYVLNISFPSENSIDIEFNCEMEQSSAENLDNYLLETNPKKNQIPITSATLDISNKIVQLILSENMITDEEYSLSVSNINDLNNFFIIPENKYNKRTFIYGNSNIQNINKVISLNPNPATNTIQFSCLLPLNNATIEIYSVSGSLINATLLSDKNEIDISNLPKGVYIIKINSEIFNFVERIIKE
ncbi:MAG: T9SS type A sorting domain-containing protein [Bacteroidales bacterium]|nr:T9SS type A sorting domain-containing protein [Bacteroidales bacterium]